MAICDCVLSHGGAKVTTFDFVLKILSFSSPLLKYMCTTLHEGENYNNSNNNNNMNNKKINIYNNECMSFLRPSLQQDYKKQMLTAAHALAVDAKNLLDVIDQSRLKMMAHSRPH